MLATSFWHRLFKYLTHALLVLLCLGAAVWLGMAWFVQHADEALTPYFLSAWGIAVCICWWTLRRHLAIRWKLLGGMGVVWCVGLGWFLSLPAQQHRDWAPDVAKQLFYERQGSLVTLHNVRNFDWRSETDFTERWETRQYDLNHISGINVLTSYWMGPQIAHTLVSFDFDNQAPLVFSIEIRKERYETFSAIGGFFRQFELSLVAADEHDIVYTRSNVRGEQVYFFPISHMPKSEMRALFEAYLREADALQTHAQWYNSLFSNCTTIIYTMAKSVSATPLPLDYRLILSGYLPNYLYDVNAISHQMSLHDWYQHAHVNPKVQLHARIDSAEYSRLLRATTPPAIAAK